MKYVYPNNLMARRSERREMIKGGILFAAFIICIIGLFLASDYSRNLGFSEPTVVCKGTDMSSCHLE